MRLAPRVFPLEIVRDHMIARLKGRAALIDTGSPLTMRAPALVARHLGQPVRWLVGTDTLARHRVLLDWPNGRATVGGPSLPGETIPLVPCAGLFQVTVEGDFGSALAFLDTGAHLSYAPAPAVRGLVPVDRARDYYPMLGEFDVDIYELTVRVGRRRIRGRFGVLPGPLALLVAGVGGSGWILGSDYFRDRTIQLDLGRSRLVDAASVPARPRTTPRTARPASPPAHGITAWRGWRLVDVGGTPRLQSLVARDLWDGPCFTSDVRPAGGHRDARSGIHAFATPGQLHSVLRGPALVYGQVTLHGEICEHETGFRAEQARVDRLFLRACGRHRAAAPPRTGLLLLDLLAIDAHWPYCGCDTLEPDEWLTYGSLERLARELGERYECDVTVDAERARTPAFACSAARARHRAGARRT